MLLRLYGLQGNCQWAYAETPPYDAVLVEASSLEANSLPAAEPSARHVLRLTRTDATDDPDTLTRPLCALKLRSWLDGVENTLSSPPASAPSPAPQAPMTAPEPTQLLRPETKTETETASEPSTLLPEDAPRFSLQRWPRQGILRGDPARIRMATLLSRRALNARDLVNLTGFEPHQCQVFMQILRASDLLLPTPLAATDTPQAVASPVSIPPPARPAKPPFTQSLIAGLRKRLGLQPNSAV